MKIVLAVGGGIAAYKSAELARLLIKSGHEVQAVLTASAQEFIRPLTFSTLTGKKVITDLFCRTPATWSILTLREEHDLLLVAPATAGMLARMAQGLADDFLSTMYLAFTGQSGAGACHERQHVEPSGNAGKSAKRCEPAAPTWLLPAKVSGVRHHRAGPFGGTGTDSRGRLRPRTDLAGRNSSDHRRSYAGADRSGALPLEPVQRQNGVRSGGSGAERAGREVILISGPVTLLHPRRGS